MSSMFTNIYNIYFQMANKYNFKIKIAITLKLKNCERCDTMSMINVYVTKLIITKSFSLHKCIILLILSLHYLRS